jgi:hypothetical protein
MVHVTIEYVIMIPLLIMQIFLLPMTANWLMNMWTEKRTTLDLRGVASHLGSTAQQIYFYLNHTTVPVTTLVRTSDTPYYIEGNPYTGTATMRSAAGYSSSKFLEITLKLKTIGTTCTYMVVLGQNAEWEESTFVSNSENAGLKATKYVGVNGSMIRLSFAG